METKYFDPKTVKPGTIPERVIQPKLEVNPPNDKYEQEADQVAEKVSRMPGNATDNLQMQPKEDEEKKLQMKSEDEDKNLQMKPEDEDKKLQMKPEEEDKKIQMKSEGNKSVSMKPEEEEKGKIQMSAGSSSNNQVPQVSSSLASQLNSTKGQGSPLSEGVSQEMGQKIGGNFNNVRVHTDDNAVQMNKELGAKAFTHGNDIYFNNGKYNPENSSGKHLLAHELTHTLQQSKTSSIQNKKIQCEFEVEPTVANPVVKVLSTSELQRALDWDRKVFTEPDEISLLRSILGESATLAVVDEDFVRAIVSYQASYGLQQDGIVGAATAGQLATELGVEATNAGSDADVGDATTMALNPAHRRMSLRSRVVNRLGRLQHQGFIGPRDNPTGIVTVRTGFSNAQAPGNTNLIGINYTGNNANDAHWLQFAFGQLSAVDPTTNVRTYQTTTVPNSSSFNLQYSNASTFHWIVDSGTSANMFYEAAYINDRDPGHHTEIFDQPSRWNAEADAFVATLGGRPNRTRLILGFDTFLVVNNQCTYHVRWNMYFNFQTATAPTPDTPGTYEILEAGSVNRLPGNKKTVLNSLFPGNTIP